MKKFSTMFCCACIALAGFYISQIGYKPSNTISAEPAPYNFPTQLVKTDTVKITERDTVEVEKKVITTKYRTKPVVRTVHRVDTVEVPVLYTRTGGDRKEATPDTLLLAKHKRVNRKVIELHD